MDDGSPPTDPQSGPTAEDQQVVKVRARAYAEARRHPAKFSDEEAQDIAQEVTVRFIDNRWSIDNALGWATTVAQHLCVDRVRLRGREWSADDLDAELLNEYVRQDPFLSTSQRTIRALQLDWVRSNVSDKEQRLLVLVAAGYPYDEIAQILGYSGADSVKTTMHRLRIRLRNAAIDQGQPTDWETHPHVY